jgi:hypothetical protein
MFVLPSRLRISSRIIRLGLRWVADFAAESQTSTRLLTAARVASGHAAAPPSSLINSRRFIA